MDSLRYLLDSARQDSSCLQEKKLTSNVCFYEKRKGIDLFTAITIYEYTSNLTNVRYVVAYCVSSMYVHKLSKYCFFFKYRRHSPYRHLNI